MFLLAQIPAYIWGILVYVSVRVLFTRICVPRVSRLPKPTLRVLEEQTTSLRVAVAEAESNICSIRVRHARTYLTFVPNLACVPNLSLSLSLYTYIYIYTHKYKYM